MYVKPRYIIIYVHVKNMNDNGNTYNLKEYTQLEIYSLKTSISF